jgi:uncharacterized damage-inducible protein DinB
MSIIKKLLKEVEQEAQTTRKMLSLVPNDKYNWQPHPKSMSIMKLTNHIAELPGWLTMAVITDGLDFAANPYQPTFFNTTADVLKAFENQLADGIASLDALDEADLEKSWILRKGDHLLSAMTKYETIRLTLAQTIHHRAQLGVYLRLLSIPIPGSYGPSADELEAMQQYAS